MTLREMIQEAVTTRDWRKASRVCDLLRSRGFKYLEILETVQEVTPITPAEWDALMYEADRAEGES